MHKSRLGALVIDCQTDDLETATSFWGPALGHETETDGGHSPYASVRTPAHEMNVLLQKVSHPSRVHLDIETDNVDAEVARLEALGAKQIGRVKTWCVMEAPTGQRFCVVRPQRSDFEENATIWP